MMIPFSPRATTRARTRRAGVLALLACLPLGACSWIDGADEYVVGVDSVTVIPPRTAGAAVHTTFHGLLGGNACAELVRVERTERPPDTLRMRFIGRQPNGNCLQMPAILRYLDSVPNAPARTVHLTVEQPRGAPLHYELVLPLLAAPDP
jgi:hypothetical protein